MNVIVGTHTSIAKGPELAFERSAAVGGTTLQIFSKSPRGRKIPEYDPEQYIAGQELRDQHDQQGGIVHSNYLANLSKADDELGVEIESILHDFEVAHELGYDAVNVHIGKLKGRASLDEAMTNMTKHVETILKEVRDRGQDDVQFLFENTAGQGSEIGSTFAEMSYFWQHYLSDLPVKFCIDTAHCQWGGIDIREWDVYIDQFGSEIGIEQLYAIHLNDSKAVLWSNLDRHASLGHGFIGRPGIGQVVERAAAHDRKLYIETPEPDRRPDEVDKVRRIAAGETDRIPAEHERVYKTQFLKKFAEQAQGQDSLLG